MMKTMATASKPSPRSLNPSPDAVLGRAHRGAWAGFFSSESGGPLIEFALVLPMMLACVTGVLTFGVSMYNAINLTQATGQGAQYLQSNSSVTSDPCSDAITAIENAAPTLKPSNITLTLSLNGGTASTGSSCTSLASSFQSAATQSYFTLSTQYPCTITVYGLNLGGCQLSSKVTYYIYK